MPGTSLSTAAFLDLSTFAHADLDLTSLEQAVDRWQWFELINENELSDVLETAEVLVSNKVFLGREHFDRAKRLKLVCIAATGTNNIDLNAAAEKGISVCNVRSYATPSVVQHVFTLLLSLTTHYDAYTHDVKAGEWSRSQHFCLLDYPVRELAGKTIGIVGYGELGKAVASIAEAFGMQVLIAKRNSEDRRPGRVNLHDLLPQVDVLSLHCPLNEDTRGLIGAEQLALMKDDAVLINTARGGLVDEAALVSALQQGKLGGAGLDVIEQEPPPEDYPLLQADLPNLIVTPHIAWISRESRQRRLDEIALNIEVFKSGEVRNRV